MFSAVAEKMGLGYDTAVKVSCGFGGGMYLGSTCGAVTGGIMAIGMKHGGAGFQPGMHTAKLVRVFADRFKDQTGSINCTELIGIDLSAIDPLAKPEALKAAVDPKVFAACVGYVRLAATIVDEIVSEPRA